MTVPRFFTLAVITTFMVIAILPLAFMLAAPFREGADLITILHLFENRHLSLAGKSLMIASGTSLCALVIGSLFAFLICRTDLPGWQLLGYAGILPLLIPPYIHALVWSYLSPVLLSVVGWDLYGVSGVILVLTFAYYPFVTLTTLAGLKTLDRSKEEAALFVQGRFSMLRRVTLPLCLPYMLSGAIFVFVFSVINVGVPDIFRVRVYPLEIFIQFSAFFDTWKATLLSFPIVAVTLILILAQRLYMGDRSYVQVGGGRKEQIRFHLGRLGSLCTLACAGLIICSAFVPIATLLVKAGGLATYTRILRSSIQSIFISFSIAAAAAILTVLLGSGLGYLQHRGTNKLTRLLVALLVCIPFAVPATTMGIGLIGIWNRPPVHWIYGSLAIMIIAHIGRFTPYATAVIHSGVGQVGVQLEETAILSGAGFSSVMFQVLAPLTKPQLLVAAFFVFVLAFGELGTSLLVSPPGVETVPVKIYNLMHYGAEEMVAALCLVLMLLIFSVASVFLWLLRK